MGNILGWHAANRVQAQVIKIHSNLDDCYNGDPVSLGPIPSVMYKNLGYIDNSHLSR